MLLEFKVDTKERKQWFTAESFAHPAKMSLPLELWLIEKYTKPGDVILDPMAGIGTILVGATLGRNIICVELEEKFCKMMWVNREKIMQRGPQMGYQMGRVDIIQGDARNLEDLPVDKIITSPPYAEMKQDDKRANDPVQVDKRAREFEKAGGNFHTPGRLRTIARHYAGYTEDQGNIGNLTYGNIDAVVTSPPYENAVHKGSGEWSQSTEGRMLGGVQSAGGKMLGVPQGEDYTKSGDNIGNLKSESYLEAMLQVYQQCHKILNQTG